MSIGNSAAIVANPLPAAPASAAPASAPPSSDGTMTFDDLLDIVNPLQHLPIVSTLYRHLTGDTIKTFPKVAGDMLYGGVTGFLGSIADTAFQKITGKSFGDTVYDTVVSLFSPSDSTGVADNAPPATPVMVASAAPLATVTGVALPPIDTTATSIASNAPALAAPASVTPASLDSIVVPGQDALLSALSRNGVSPDVALRAADAYRRTVIVSAMAINGTTPGPRASFAQ